MAKGASFAPARQRGIRGRSEGGGEATVTATEASSNMQMHIN